MINRDYSEQEIDCILEDNASKRNRLVIRVYHYGFINIYLKVDGVARETMCDSFNRLANIVVAQMWVCNALAGDHELCEEWNPRGHAPSTEPFETFEISLEEGADDIIRVLTKMSKSNIYPAEILGRRLLQDIEHQAFLAYVPPSPADMDLIMGIDK